MANETEVQVESLSASSAADIPPSESIPAWPQVSSARRRVSQDKVKRVAEMLGLTDGDEEEVLIRLIDEFLALKNT